MKNKQLELYIKDRDYILKNLETISFEEIKQWCIKWKTPMPLPLFLKEELVKGALHKARLGLTKLTNASDKELEELKEKSRKALDKLKWSDNFSIEYKDRV